MPRIASVPVVAVIGILAGCVPAPQQIMAQPMPPPMPPPMLAPMLAQGPVVLSYPPIPAPRMEVIPAPPPRRREVMVWQPGHWHWDGFRYEWLAGHYTARVVGTTHWVPGHWVPHPGGYAWERGHWA